MISKNQLKYFASLNQKKFRNEAGVFLIEGRKMVEEAMKENVEIVNLIATGSFFDSRNVQSDDSIKVIAGAKDMERISALKKAPEVIAVVKQFENKTVDIETEIILALDSINDPGNFGTIIRTCDWFGVTDILCSNDCVELYNSKVVQASMGSIFRVNVSCVNLRSELVKLKDEHNYKIIIADMEGESIYSNSIAGKKIILLGSESHGISKDLFSLATKTFAIPKFGNAESLNVSIANAIILSELKR